MSVGDINGTERGTAARFNDGKTPFDLVPLRAMAGEWRRRAVTDEQSACATALDCIGQFQEGGGEEWLYRALIALGDGWTECAAVLDYGRRKYAPWNWARGQAYSVVIACAARHLQAMFDGESIDPPEKKGSGLPHRGHVYCNVVFLLTFLRTYPEGDDRPAQLRTPAPGGMTAERREAITRDIADLTGDATITEGLKS